MARAVAQAWALRLDELIRATHTASNSMMTVEQASPADLSRIGDDFRDQAESATRDGLSRPRTDS